MAYPGASMHGYGGMPMPMPQAGHATYPSSTPSYPSQTAAPYSSSSQPPYPGSTPYPVADTSPQNQSSVNVNEVDMWMDKLIANLKNLIKDASKTDLEQLVNNENKIIDLVQSSEETKNLQKKREEIVQHNKDQAVTNLSLEPELGVLKSELMELAHKQNKLRERYTELSQSLSGKVSLDSIHAVLQAATAEKESESDKMSQEFLAGDKSVDAFIDEYISERKIYQLRKVKSDKMTQLLRTGALSINNSNFNRPTPMPRARPPPSHGGYGPPTSGYGGYGGY